ncbi:type I secretion system permease/ATPase [Aestuariispira insulae]|uniref:ATP-binding cassette subfamily B protein RtxB n=1 Tax=Aestuariispira insulae TaxID=1461337 RepID=A0A3D9H565_9PROT|nr:type I secretion system permease/ATPase [Aestuariispira insulae]RED44658.1 ATP-binding cassette subfamily B protein RtxB [Aestuariispira insulae]
MEEPHKGNPETTTLLSCAIILGMIFKEIPDQKEAAEAAEGFLDQEPKLALKGFAKTFGMKTKMRKADLGRISETQLPMAARTESGLWFVLAKLSDDGALIQRPGQPQPDMVTLEQLEKLWSGMVMTCRGQNRTSGDTRPFDVTWFIPEFLRFKGLAWEVLAASFFLETLALVSPLFFQVVMDKVLVHNALSTLDVLVTVLVIVSVLEVGLKTLRQYVATHTALRVDGRLGGKLFRRLVDLPLSYFKARSVGITVMRVRELDSIREFLTGAANTLIIDLTFTFVFFGVMYYYSPFLTMIVLGAIPFYAALSYFITGPLQVRIEAMYRDGAVNNSFLNEALNGVETVKALALEPKMTQRWEGQTEKFVGSNFEVQRLMQLSSQGVQIIQKVTMILILWFGARMVIDLELSIGQLIAFNMMANHVSQPIIRLAELYRNYIQSRVSIDRLGDVLNTPTEMESGQVDPGAELKGRITLQNVTFRYAPNLPPVLENFSLNIPAGKKVAFVGASGSGKSTIAKLIQKLYVPESGEVQIDGRNMAELDAVALRQRMSIVLQENYLFNRSVRENIALTDPAAPLSRVIEASKIAGAHEFILELTDGYDTVLAEGGSSLSGGQRQRVAIARALMNDPSILIFDEATSALDDHSQNIIQQNMPAISEDRTVIIIAHRLSTVRDCDFIFVLEKGQIVEGGPHDELLAKGAAYARLWALQSNMELEEEQPASPPVQGGLALGSIKE